MRTQAWGGLILAVMLGTAAVGQGTTLAGVFGIELTFTPVPPATLEVDTAIVLSLSFAGAEVTSRTQLSLDGLVAEHITMGVNLDGIVLRTGMRFDPCFSLYWFEVRGGCCPFDLGALFLVENLAGACQTPDYTIGVVLDLGMRTDLGLAVRSLTGFGVRDLYHLIDDDPTTDIAAVPGWWFEEELVSLSFTTSCFRADSVLLFDPVGFAWGQFVAAYRFPSPEVEMGAGVRLDAGLALDWAELFLGLAIDPVTLRSATTFDLLGFVAQEVEVSVAFSGVRLYSRTRFDFTGLLQEVIGFTLTF